MIEALFHIVLAVVYVLALIVVGIALAPFVIVLTLIYALKRHPPWDRW